MASEKMKNVPLILALLFFFSLHIVKAEDDSNPLFVTITMKECYTCQKLKPVIENLKEEYNDKVNFVTLDVSSKASLEESREKAEELGVKEFFEKNRNSLPAVGIVCPGGTMIEKAFLGESDINTYKNALDELLLDVSKLCSL